MKIIVKLIGSAWRHKKNIETVEVASIRWPGESEEWQINIEGFEVEFVGFVED
jgi:hypothetical protein